MKVNRKTVLSTAAVLGVVALAAGGTIAYFTDKVEPISNNFTIGNVDIDIFESQLHRMNSGRQGSFGALASDPDYCDWNANPNDSGLDSNIGLIKGSYEKARYCTPLMNANEGDSTTITAVANGHTRTSNPARTWGYMDSTIETDAANYKAGADTATTDDDGYFTRVSKNIVPGQWVRKFTYVKNKDTSSDAYVLIRYMVPTSYADNVELKVPGTPYEEDSNLALDGHQGYFTALTKNADGYAAFDASTADAMDNYTGYTETIDGTEYRVYAAVTTDALKPGEMTYWSPINTVRLKKTATNLDPQDPNYVAPAAMINVKVDAQAIQAKTFSNAIDAINEL